MSTKIDLVLTVEDVNRLLTLLGDQPIKSGLNDLTINIKAQGDRQLLAQQATAEADSGIVDVNTGC